MRSVLSVVGLVLCMVSGVFSQAPGGPPEVEDISTQAQRTAVAVLNNEVGYWSDPWTPTSDIPPGFLARGLLLIHDVDCDTKMASVAEAPAQVTQARNYILELRNTDDFPNGPIVYANFPIHYADSYQLTPAERTGIDDLHADYLLNIPTMREDSNTKYNTMQTSKSNVNSALFVCQNWVWGETGKADAISYLDAKIAACSSAVSAYGSAALALDSKDQTIGAAAAGYAPRVNHVKTRLTEHRDSYLFWNYHHNGVNPAPVWPW